jgi:chorismate mutase/prephenate dehydratase
VAYLGPAGTFSHQAATVAFGHSVSLRAQPEFSQIFEEVGKREAAYGVVPIENSIEGMVYRSLDLLLSYKMGICAEIYMPIHHSLLSRAKDLSRIKKIYSHAQAWGQCGLWLESHGFDHRHFEEVTSTAKAAMLARASSGSAAAIASAEAGRVYQVPMLREGIQDSLNNETRFAVIGFDKPGPTGRDKTTVVFQAEDRVGFLARILRELADAEINLTKIESRPSRVKDWDYLFYIEMEGHVADPRVSETLTRLEKQCPFFRHLGSYPQYRAVSSARASGRMALELRKRRRS